MDGEDEEQRRHCKGGLTERLYPKIGLENVFVSPDRKQHGQEVRAAQPIGGSEVEIIENGRYHGGKEDEYRYPKDVRLLRERPSLLKTKGRILSSNWSHSLT